jgi:hypothetical protein
VTGIDRNLVDDVLAKFLAHFRQPVYAELSKISRIFYLT